MAQGLACYNDVASTIMECPISSEWFKFPSQKRPHSLSYQETNFTKVSLSAIPALTSKIEDALQCVKRERGKERQREKEIETERVRKRQRWRQRQRQTQRQTQRQRQ